MKGAITFRFDCEVDEQAQAYWRAMIEASRPITCVSVSEVVVELNVAEDAVQAPPVEVTVEEPEPEPGPGFPRPHGWK